MLYSPKYYFHKKDLTCPIGHSIMTIVTKKQQTQRRTKQ